MKRQFDRTISFIRDFSRSEVLDVVRRERLLSRSELCEAVSVSRATVSGIVADLLAIGLLEEVGVGPSTGGRRPIKLAYRPVSRKAVGIVMFNNRIQAALTDMEGEALNYLEIPLEGLSPEAMLSTMKSAAHQIMLGVAPEELLGIGVGAPGIVDFESGTIEISIGTPWIQGGIHVKTYLAEALKLPVYVANRSQVAALGENLAGVGRNVSNLIYFVLDQGIVAGFVVNGGLYLGSGFAAGQIGHVSIEPDGPLCRCGNRGCLQLYASEEAILAQARAVAREEVTSLLWQNTAGRVERLTPDMVFEAARQGDASALAVMNEAGAKVGFAVATLINLFDPEMVVLGGTIGTKAGDLLLKPATREAQVRALPRSFQKTRIVTGTLGTNALAIGAAVLAIKNTPISMIFEGRPATLAEPPAGNSRPEAEASPEVAVGVP
jgi:predicted NBD/HSP70 family sugar kinase